jgi:hypothetical protein
MSNNFKCNEDGNIMAVGFESFHDVDCHSATATSLLHIELIVTRGVAAIITLLWVLLAAQQPLNHVIHVIENHDFTLSNYRSLVVKVNGNHKNLIIIDINRSPSQTRGRLNTGRRTTVCLLMLGNIERQVDSHSNSS